MPKKGAKLGASSLEDMAGARRATHEGEDKGRAEEGSSSVGSSTRDGRGETKVGGVDASKTVGMGVRAFGEGEGGRCTPSASRSNTCTTAILPNVASCC